MKLKHIIALLVIVLLVGCAKKAPEPVEVEPEPVVVEPEPEPEPELTPDQKELQDQKEAAAAEEVDVLITLDGFQPGEVTMKVGDTVKWKNKVETIGGIPKRIVLADKGHKIQSNIRLAYDDVYEYTFTEAGEYEIFDVTFNVKDNMILTIE